MEVDTYELSIIWTSQDGVNDREGEFSFCNIFAETFVIGILRIL